MIIMFTARFDYGLALIWIEELARTILENNFSVSFNYVTETDRGYSKM